MSDPREPSSVDARDATGDDVAAFRHHWGMAEVPPEVVPPVNRRRLRRHLSPPMVISCLALFVALGGTGYAAVKLPKNSVGATQLKPASVSSSKVKNGTLLSRDFKKGELPRGITGKTGAAGAAGAQGPAGPQGGQGPAGANGANGTFSSVITRSVQTTVGTAAATRTISLLARCNVGEIAVGGGGTFAGGSADGTSLSRSAPHRVVRDAAGNPVGDTVPDGPNSSDGWTVTGTNSTTGAGAGDRTLRAFVLCVPLP